MKQIVRIFENDNFVVDYDKEKKKYRVSTFRGNCDALLDDAKIAIKKELLGE